MNKKNSLTPEMLHIVNDKGTEPSCSGIYNQFDEKGSYLCRQCGLALFRSDHKFISTCGWPSFDGELPNAIKRQADNDGRRTEILCKRCDAHLGHEFKGEQLTGKNLRHCVNSLALDFVVDEEAVDTEEAIYAAGCFWGVEYYLNKEVGVLKTEVGYAGGQTRHPTYEDVCRGKTGHLEVIRVIYDPSRINYETLTKLFFEIHDPTQTNGQGPDIGLQYLSAIFYFNEQQKSIAKTLIAQLEAKGLSIATMLKPVTTFWLAEDHHQAYYDKNGKQPYCHRRVKRF